MQGKTHGLFKWCEDSVEREGFVCKREKGKSHALRALSLPILESSFSTSKKQVLLLISFQSDLFLDTYNIKKMLQQFLAAWLFNLVSLCFTLLLKMPEVHFLYYLDSLIIVIFTKECVDCITCTQRI